MSVAGSLYGLAYGDAIGGPVEFSSYESILSRYGPGGPRELPEPARVTDDTQMALAVAAALLSSPGLVGLEDALTARFTEWLHDPENTRAPGRTCLDACAGLDRGLPWVEATVATSKGCGANMRVTPIALVPGLTDAQRSGAAQLQAALTHGHPTGVVAADLTMRAVRLLLDGCAPADLLTELISYAEGLAYEEEWLGGLWRRFGSAAPADYTRLGVEESVAALEVVRAAPLDADGDPCLLTGAGWIAEEALATSLYAYLRHPDEPVTAVAYAAPARATPTPSPA